MGMRSARCFAAFSFGWAMLVTVRAHAGSMDPALERLAANPECRTAAGAIEPAGGACRPDQGAFTRLVNQFGTAFAPTALNPARTTGIAGFQVSLEGSFTSIDSDADYWRAGTRGSSDRHLGAAGQSNTDPASFLQLYSLRLRKGFGAGVEVAGQFGFMPRTSFLSGGVDARWAILEGFREGTMGYVPDVSLGGGVRTTTGSAQMQLTVAAADLRLSKPIPVRGEAVVTPWAGLQYLWIHGDSRRVDMTPATDAAGYCNQQGVSVPGDPSAPPEEPRDGEPLCAGGSAADFANDVRFDAVRLRRPRLLLGGSVRYELVNFSAQFLVDLTAPHQGQGSDAARAALRGESRQWGIAVDAGVQF